MEKNEAYWILIAKYLKGDISAEEKKDLFNWLEVDPSNKAVFDQMQRLWVLSLNSGDNFTPDVDVAWTKFKSKTGIQQETSNTETAKIYRIGFQEVWRVAAVVILAVGLVFIARFYFKAENMIEIKASAEKKEFFLPDGSKIWLNRNSSLSYPQNFNFEERKVILKGEAFFDVKKADGKKFVIYGFDSRTEVVGTSFNVKAYENEKVTVSVVTGRVAFSSEKDETSRIYLEPGEKGTLEKGEKIIKEKIENPNATAWKNNLLIFNNTNLKDVVSTLKDYFGRDITVANAQILNCRFTGTFEAPELEEVLEILSTSINSSYQIKEGHVILDGQGCK
jgi:transmembrane sensor